MNILFFLTPKEDVAYVTETDTFGEVLKTLKEHHFSAVPVLSKEGKYIGTITEGDMLWTMAENDFTDVHAVQNHKIKNIKRRRDNQAVNVMATIEDIFQKITNQNFVPVVDDNKVFIGIVTRKDILLYLKKRLAEEEEK